MIWSKLETFLALKVATQPDWASTMSQLLTTQSWTPIKISTTFKKRTWRLMKWHLWKKHLYLTFLSEFSYQTTWTSAQGKSTTWLSSSQRSAALQTFSSCWSASSSAISTRLFKRPLICSDRQRSFRPETHCLCTAWNSIKSCALSTEGFRLTWACGS